MSRKNKSVAGISPQPTLQPTKSSFDWNIWLIMGFAMLLYAATFGYDFVLDDDIMTRSNIFVNKGISGIWDIFTHGTLYGFNGMNDQSYRPLTLANFALEKSMFDGTPGAYHFFNVFYYALSCGVFYLFLKRALGKDSLIPLLAALLFVAHPIHTEVAANIKSRDEILSFLFVTTSLLYLLKYTQDGNKPAHLVVSLVCYLAAALAKETGLAMLGLIPLTLWFFTPRKADNIVLVSLIYLVPVALYFVMRRSAMDNMFFSSGINDVINNTLSGAQSGGEWFASRVMILGKYLLLLVFPHPLSYDYSYNQVPLVGLGDRGFMISLAVHLGLAALFVWGLIYKKTIAYGIGFYAVMLVLVSNFLTPVGATMAERFLFTSSAGFCLALGWGILALVEKFQLSKNILYSIVGTLLLLYCVKTYTRTQVWKESETLFQSGLETAPHSARAQNHYATHWRQTAEKSQDPRARTENYLKSITYYQKALEIYPRYSEAQYNTGVSYMGLNKSEDARIAFEKTLAIDSTYQGALNNLGVIAYNKQNFQVAMSYWTRLLSVNPKNADALQNCGAVYVQMGDLNKALEYLEKANQIAPNNPNTVKNLKFVKEKLQTF